MKNQNVNHNKQRKVGQFTAMPGWRSVHANDDLEIAEVRDIVGIAWSGDGAFQWLGCSEDGGLYCPTVQVDFMFMLEPSDAPPSSRDVKLWYESWLVSNQLNAEREEEDPLNASQIGTE